MRNKIKAMEYSLQMKLNHTSDMCATRRDVMRARRLHCFHSVLSEMYISVIDASLTREFFRHLGNSAAIFPVIRIIMHMDLRGVHWLAGVALRVAWLRVIVI